MSYIERWFSMPNATNFAGGGTLRVIQANSGAIYVVFVNTASDVAFVKSTDGGLNWTNQTTVFAGTVTQLSVWYDRWSGLSADLIHCAYTESGGHDVLYRTIDAGNSDTLGTQTTIFNGASAAGNNGLLSIARARGGNLGCIYCIDAAAEYGFSKSTDAGATWAPASDVGANEGDTLDQAILMPGWAADNQDLMMFFWDASADEISRKLYDDDGDAWAETSIAGTMLEATMVTDGPHWAATVDTANSRNLLVAWSARDAANADLRCWHVTEAAITEVTNVVLNSTDDQMGAAIGIDTNTGYWYVAYMGISTGGETVPTSLHVYYKVSTDSGSTWGSETQLSPTTKSRRQVFVPLRFTGPLWVIAHIADDNNIFAILMNALRYKAARVRLGM
jgi:hypothetical protein